MSTTSRSHRHKEAFCLMWYACKDCSAKERIWNSRDGVTPFGINCRSCGKSNMLHVDWGRDEFAPDHKPVKGQRIFRDGTPNEAEAIMRARIERCKGTEYEVTDPEVLERLLATALSGEGEFQKGWPVLDVAP